MKAKKIGIIGSLTMAVSTIMVSANCEKFLSAEDWQKRLSEAACDGNIRLMERAIAHGADVNKFCCGRTPPLNSAAGKGHFEAVQFLISRRANINVGDKFNATPLMEASRGGHIEIVKLLLQHGADPNAVEYMNGSSVLDWADGNPEIINLLREHGAVIEHPGIWERLTGKHK